MATQFKQTTNAAIASAAAQMAIKQCPRDRERERESWANKNSGQTNAKLMNSSS